MKTVNIVVLDYSGATVNYYWHIEIEANGDLSEMAENWIVENTEHRLSNCSWMISEKEFEIIENL